jgi:beta-glucuronidase
MLKRLVLTATLVFVGVLVPEATAQDRLGLNGKWNFALDPLDEGAGELGWYLPEAPAASWDSVRVPSTWSIDPRYLGYIGKAWYRKTVQVPASMEGKHLRLVFDAVFYEATVWVNGEPVGAHEGGYTPFRLDVTEHLTPGEENLIAVRVSNEWTRTTIPGARYPSGRKGYEASALLYPWWDYGGIIRDVALVASAPVYVTGQKVVAAPNLDDGTASVETTVRVANATDAARERQVDVTLRRGPRENEGEAVAGEAVAGRRDGALSTSVRVPARDTASVTLRTTLPSDDVSLWHPDHPHLYTARAVLRTGGESSHTRATTFGIRSVEVRDAKFFLNGEPIRMGGANRHSDYPGVGNVEPDSVIERDMTLLKKGNMQMMRLHHYASPKNALRWADRNGMLLIGEAGLWGAGPRKLSDPGVRALFKQQTEEMMRRDWNHPSIIAWSTGNEYASDTPEGADWTKDMHAFINDLDPTRPVTFAALAGKIFPPFGPPDSTSLHHVDFISTNFYNDPSHYTEALEATHAEWPDTPIFITEWGKRAEENSPEERVRYVRDFLDMVRERDYIFGASFWSYNDYRSRFPGTAPDGYRHWGLVTPEREPRPAYHTMRKELAPLTVSGAREEGAVRFQLTGRDDFPRYTLRGYEARLALLDDGGEVLKTETREIETLAPGETVGMTFDTAAHDDAAMARLTVGRPTGFRVSSRVVELR